MPLETTQFDVQRHLRTRRERVAYLKAAIETNDPEFLALALGDIARAEGVATFARKSGLSRATVYKSFRKGGNPTIATFSKATKALGLKMALVAAN